MKRTDSTFWHKMEQLGQKAETKAVQTAITPNERKDLDDGFKALALSQGVIRR